MRSFLFFIFVGASFTLFCCSESKDESESTIHRLSDYERKLCVDQNVDTNLVVQLWEIARPDLTSFRPDSVFYFDNTGHWSYRPSRLQGVTFEASTALAGTLCEKFSSEFNKHGHSIFIYEMNFDDDGHGDKLAIVNTADKYKILRETGTDGINYDIDNDSLISIIQSFDVKYGLTLTGAGLDWCTFAIKNQQIDWQTFAEEVYEVCPDVVDQGAGTVEDLGKEMQEFKTLYLWWD